MNRRGFLGALTAAIAAVQLPLAAASPVTVTNVGGSFVFTGPELFDLGYQVGLCIALPDGRRHAVRTLCTPRASRRADVSPQQILELKRHLLDWAESQYMRKAA